MTSAVSSWMDKLARIAPDLCRAARPPANAMLTDELVTTARSHGMDVPQDYVEALAVHDGEDAFEQPSGLFFGLVWMPARETLAEIEEFAALSSDDDEPFRPPTASPASRPWRWRSRLPFAKTGTGNFLAFDFAPGPEGKIGQVITVGRDVDIIAVVADDFTSFVRWCEAQLDSGSFERRPSGKLLLPDRHDPISRFGFPPEKT